jgi:putative oxidoreductase
MTRPAAFILSGLMAFAYWIAHGPKSFYPILNGGEAAMLFCFIFLYIATVGPGAFALDSRKS